MKALYVCMNECNYVCVYLCMCCIRTYTCAGGQAFIQTHAFLYVCLCTTRLCVFIYLCIYVVYMYVFVVKNANLITLNVSLSRVNDYVFKVLLVELYTLPIVHLVYLLDA